MKIVQVMNAMISNPEKISNVLQNDGEYYFLYDKKHKWSIKSLGDNYTLFFYPTNTLSIEQLATNDDWVNFSEVVSYTSQEIKTREATESFSELYQIVSEKLYGLDDIFDEIIGNK